MSESGPSCFISYCHDDIDRDTLTCLLEILENHLGRDVNIYFDVRLGVGEDFDDFMGLLNAVDTVLVLMTPAYKAKVERRTGGVYTEYKTIVSRYFELREQRRNAEIPPEVVQPLSFSIRPVLFSGDMSSSVPAELTRLKHVNLAGFRALRDSGGKPYLPTHGNVNYLREIESLARQIKSGTAAKSDEYRELYSKYFKALFIDLKADWRNPEHKSRGWVKQMFVKTSVSQKVERQEVIAIVGRKGSGKSTLVDVLAIRGQHRFRGVVDIRADDFSLEYSFDKFTDERRPLKSDTDYALRRFDCLAFAWKAYLYTCAIDALVQNEFAEGELIFDPADKQTLINFHTQFMSPNEKLQDAYSRTHAASSAYLVYTHDQMEAFIEDLISTARSEQRYFFHDITRGFTELSFLHYALGRGTVEALERIIEPDGRRILVTLDGFDTAFDMFRRDRMTRFDDLGLQERSKFELDWLRSLLITVLDMRSGRSSLPRLDSMFEFCFMIPEDRFLEIERTDRDSYRYQGRYHSLNWSGIELALLLRKRLQGLKMTTTRKGSSVRESLEFVLKSEFDHIPQEVSVPFNGRNYRMPLFMYVLRHTFWRPRDVLVYYAGILAMADDLKRRGYEVTFEDIRKSVSQTTLKVVRSEFINEFRSSVLNISAIVNAFVEQKQTISFTTLQEILGSVNFEWTSGSDDARSLPAKIRFLYQIGFLGINASRDDKMRLRLLHDHAFYFNEGLALFRGDRTPNLSRYQFVIHPIFCEYLELDTSDQPLTLVFDWKYLEQSESLIFAGGGNWTR